MGWLTKDYTVGQLNAIVKKIGHDNAQRILSMKKARVIILYEYLERVGELVLSPVRGADTFSIQQLLDNVYVRIDHSFLQYISAQMEMMCTTLPERKIARFNVTDTAYDDEIRRELPLNHAFGDVIRFCADIECMILRQKDGQSGDLVNNGNNNIFFLYLGKSVKTVSVFWNHTANVPRWTVTIPLNNYWAVGTRVFSASAE